MAAAPARRRTKIVATLGPSSETPEAIDRLIESGVDVFRINFAHGDHDRQERMVQDVRAAAARRQEPVAILADLAGPKIRAGRFRDGGIELTAGELVTITTREVLGEPGLIPSDYAALHQDVRRGDRILLDDGRLALRVEAVSGHDVQALVVTGGRLLDRKGMNLPGVALSVGALTAKDREDARFAAGIGVDILGLSFVRRASDLVELAAELGVAREAMVLLAKIEKPEALAEIDPIIAAADAIMVARGDLGVELEPERVPGVQDDLVSRAIAAQKPVVIATQMLESMMEGLRPSRAEAADIAHAVLSGADALMLAGETAAGRHPVAAVAMMDRVIRETESRAGGGGVAAGSGSAGDGARDGAAMARAVAQAARALAERTGAGAILVLSRSGASARAVSAARPSTPVFVLSPDPQSCRRVNLLWGVRPIRVEAGWDGDPAALARRVCLELGLCGPGQRVLLVRGFDADPASSSPSLTVFAL